MSSLDFFEAFCKPPVVIGGRASATQERKVEPIEVVEPPRHSGRDYVREHVKREEESYETHHEPKLSLPDEDNRDGMSEVDTGTHCVSEMTDVDQLSKLKVFDEVSFDHKNPQPNLPILAEKDAILRKIDSYRAIIIQGNTGCGKTTQVPQFILDHCKERKQAVNIIVTQPRRIAAISVANRVCEERNWPIGKVVGYQIGQQRKIGENTLITYCTTGVLLQKLIVQKQLSPYTHVILDEVHERDSEMDFLLILIRRYANTNSRNVKVILMSATINTDMFSEYFYVTHGKEKTFAPVHKIHDKSQHNVRVFYLNDLSNISEAYGTVPEGSNPEITKKGYITAAKVIKALDQLEKNTTEKTKNKVEVGAVLVFLPGLYEIEEMKKQLDLYSSDVYKWWAVPLHSSITTDEQDKVFHKPPQNHRKIVLSTNIAESSITVEDIKYVIDFCLTKVVVTDPQTNLAGLQLCWASKNSLIQRAGRAGRVGPGRVYRLIEKEFYNELDEESTPEILRCPLDQLVLQVKTLDAGPPKAIFALAMSQPDLRNIEQTVLSLKEMGALTVTTTQAKRKGKTSAYIDDLDGDMTRLGQMLAKLPMDVRLGKLIFYGDLFNVLDECIIMACAMSVKNMFSSPFQEYLKAYNSKLAWANSTCSDCIAYLNAYKVWRKKKSENAFRNVHEIDWCRNRFLQLKILKEISFLCTDIKMRLKSLGKYDEDSHRPKLEGHDRNLFIKLALAAAFYPNYFLRGSHSGKIDEKDAVATLSGHDPFATVYLQGMSNNQYGILYKKTIEKQFEEVSSRVNVHFDHGSKVLINFGHYAVEGTAGGERQTMMIPGKIDLSVYRAVKMRQIKPEIRIPVFTPAEAEKRIQNYLKRHEELKSTQVDGVKLVSWPWDKSADNHTITQVELRITHVESPTRFWARSALNLVAQQFQEIEEFLNGPNGVRPIAEDENIKVGNVYAYKLKLDGREGYFRCRIESYKYFNDSYGISFIDIGEGKTGVKRQNIRAITHLQQNHYDEIPDLAREFCLVKVQQPQRYEGKWHQKAIQFLERFKTVIDHRRVLVAKIYSVVQNVVRVRLFYRHLDDRSELKNCNSINCQLIEKKLADRTEEPFLSKQDHEERKHLTKLIDEGKAPICSNRILTEKQDLIEKLSKLDIDEPTRSECRHEIVLKGPFSPLEMRIFSVTKSSMPKLARIERNSVNSVLLDTNPSDEYERMVVASYVGINSSRDKLSLRDTTIMPSLPGLPTLVCLFFSPMVEMRCDKDFTRFTGALCGLGYEKNNKRALNGDNDMEIVFDVEITLDTLLKINRVRYWLNKFFALDSQSTRMSPEEVAEGLQKLRDYINELVWSKWEPEELIYTTEAHQWGRIPKDKLMNPCTDALSDIDEPTDDLDSVYRLIWGVELSDDNSVHLEMIRKNLKSLEEFREGRLFVKDVECKLCQIVLPNRMNARLHLKSSLHKARASKYLEDDDMTYDSRSEVTSSYNG